MAHCTNGRSSSTVVEHCDERSSDPTHGNCEIDGTVGVETAPRGHESRKASAARTCKDFRRLGLDVQRIRGYARSCLSSPAESSETITNSGDGDSTLRTAVCNLPAPAHDVHTARSTESREESWKQFRSLETTFFFN